MRIHCAFTDIYPSSSIKIIEIPLSGLFVKLQFHNHDPYENVRDILLQISNFYVFLIEYFSKYLYLLAWYTYKQALIINVFKQVQNGKKIENRTSET